MGGGGYDIGASFSGSSSSSASNASAFQVTDLSGLGWTVALVAAAGFVAWLILRK